MRPFLNTRSTSDDPRPLERFKPTNGIFVGWAGLAVAAFAIGYTALYVHDLVGLRIGLGALFAAVVIWVSQLRPRATAYPGVLHLKNSLRDSHVPYVLIDEVAMGQTLTIWSAGRRFVCVGIGKSLGTDIRQRAKKERKNSLLGSSRWHDFSERAEAASLDERATDYQTFVVTRIEELVDEARREQRRRPEQPVPGGVRQVLAVPEIVALCTTGLAFAVSLLL